jgi:hypothetical protein
MWDFLGSVARTFLLFRDVFGYVIPGALLIGSAAYGKKLGTLTQSWSGDNWLVIVIVLVACYVAGQILVSIGYLVLFDFWKLFQPRDKELEKIHAKKDADLLFYRYVYPDLFIERDRRDTIDILRIGLAVALVAGFWLLPYPLDIGALILGAIMGYSGYTGAKHVGDFGDATIAAGGEALTKKVPFVTRK